MGNYPPSHFVPEKSEAAFGLMLLYTSTLIVALSASGVLGCGTFIVHPAGSPALTILLTIGAGFLAVGFEIGMVALFRHYRYVRPYRLEAAHHCPECGYEIGVERMEFGCPECGWQR